MVDETQFVYIFMSEYHMIEQGTEFLLCFISLFPLSLHYPIFPVDIVFARDLWMLSFRQTCGEEITVIRLKTPWIHRETSALWPSFIGRRTSYGRASTDRGQREEKARKLQGIELTKRGNNCFENSRLVVNWVSLFCCWVYVWQSWVLS